MFVLRPLHRSTSGVSSEERQYRQERAVHSTARSGQCQYHPGTGWCTVWASPMPIPFGCQYVQERDVEENRKTPVPRGSRGPVLPQSSRQDRKKRDTFLLKEGQNIFCPYITVEKGLRTFKVGAQYFVPLS